MAIAPPPKTVPASPPDPAATRAAALHLLSMHIDASASGKLAHHMARGLAPDVLEVALPVGTDPEIWHEIEQSYMAAGWSKATIVADEKHPLWPAHPVLSLAR